MSLSKHLQRCISFTIGALATGLAIKYRHHIWNYFRQNSRENFHQFQKRPSQANQQGKFDIWIIYSGPDSLKWTHEILVPNMGPKRIAIGHYPSTPGRYKSDIAISMATKCEKIIIVYGPETTCNPWFQYQLEIAWLNHGDKIWLCKPGNEDIYIRPISPQDLDQMKCSTDNFERKSKKKVWVINSGPKSLTWASNALIPLTTMATITFDDHDGLPGKTKADTLTEIAQECTKILIVLGAETSPNRWLRYQVEVALLKGPQNVLVCHLDRQRSNSFDCLMPLRKLDINQMRTQKVVEEMEGFLNSTYFSY